MMPLPVYVLCVILIWPGLNTFDSTWQREQFASGKYSKHHSLLDTYVFQGILGHNDLGRTNLLQSMVLAVCVIAALAILSRRVGRKWIAALTAVYSLYPLFPLYAAVRTKDTVAAGFTLLLAAALYELIESRGTTLRRYWCVFGIGVLLFVCNEYRKNNFIFVLAVLVFLAIRYRAQWRQVVALFMTFLALTAAWGAFQQVALRAAPSETTEMLGVPLQQIGYIYHEDRNGDPQRLPEHADRYFTAFRSAQDWSDRYDPLLADGEKIFALNNVDLPEFLANWTSMCSANMSSCVTAYWRFEEALVNPAAVTNDQYWHSSAMAHMDATRFSQTKLALVPHYLVNAAFLNWWLIVLAVVSVRRRPHVLPLFLIPAGIVLSIMLAALDVEIRILLPVFLCAPLLTAAVLTRRGA